MNELKSYIKATWYRWLLVLVALAGLVWLGHMNAWQLPTLLSFR